MTTTLTTPAKTRKTTTILTLNTTTPNTTPNTTTARNAFMTTTTTISTTTTMTITSRIYMEERLASVDPWPTATTTLTLSLSQASWRVCGATACSPLARLTPSQPVPSLWGRRQRWVLRDTGVEVVLLLFSLTHSPHAQPVAAAAAHAIEEGTGGQQRRAPVHDIPAPGASMDSDAKRPRVDHAASIL